MVNSATTTESPATTAATDSSVVLVVAASESIAKRIESHLRNHGHAIRTAWVTDVEDVSESLRRGAPDLVLCGAASSPETPCKDVLALCQRLAPELPVLALSPRGDTQQRLMAMSQGARDGVACDDEHDLRHLELVLLRELAVHRKARDLKLTRKRLQDFESRHQELLSGTNDAVAHVQEGILAHLNPAFAQLLGYDDPEPLAGQPLMDLVAPEFQSKVKEQLRLLARGKTDNRILDGALLHRDGAGIPIHARLTVSEIDGEQLIEMLIRAEAVPAPAPIVSNAPGDSSRLAFFDALDASLRASAPQQRQGIALLLTIDGFATLEQQLGLHDSEQAVLQLRDWLATQLAEGDQLFRFSGHELAIVRSGIDLDALQTWMDRLSADTAQQIFSTSGHEAQLSLSVAAYPFNGSETALALVTELAAAVRQLASRGTRQILMLGATAQSSRHEREDALKAELVRKALADNRLKLAYQSIMSLEGDPRQHFDVFVRLIDESGHELHAAEFLGAAEKSQQMRLVDRWVTTQALKVQSKRSGADEPTSLFIKISEETLKDSEDFIPWLRELIRTRPLKAGELVFQFQELALQNHIRKAKLITRALIDLGAEVAIEHFGIGSNSAQMIEQLPMQFLKFHQSFTRNFGDKDTLQRMSALAELAKQRKIKVIVSHIEDANAMARLWQMGVNFIQGYHIQEPEVVMLSADRR